MLSVEDICNKALNYLQANFISSIDDGSFEAQRCKGVYDSVRDSVLEEAWWQFAKFSTQPTLLANETVPGWAYLYIIPPKVLAIRNVFIDISSTQPDTIEFEQCVSPIDKLRVIATNIADPWLATTYQVTDPSFYPSKFTECFAMKLAIEICESITGVDTKSRTLLPIYGAQISEAKRLDGQNRKIVKTREPSLLTARG